MELRKEEYWMNMNSHNKLNKIDKSNEFFKKWYMAHSLDWMEGFNECLDIVVECL